MEKKNTILLTVIAIATLLVAVVGATFAYFTASISTEGDATNATTNVTTRTMASATMKLGSIMSSADTTTNVLPGFKMVKSVVVTGAADPNANPIEANIVLTAGGDIADFGSHIKYKVYSKTGEATEEEVKGLCTESKPKSEAITETPGSYKFFDEMTCTMTGLTEVANGSGTFTGTTPVNVKINVAQDTTTTYYIYVEYENATADQTTAESGKSFSVALDFKPTV